MKSELGSWTLPGGYMVTLCLPVRATLGLPPSVHPDIRHEPVVLIEGDTRDDVGHKRKQLIEDLIRQGSLGHDASVPDLHFVRG